MKLSTKRGTRVALVLMALGLVSVAEAADAPPASVRILIKDFMFSPMEVKTVVGVPVTWVNQDDEPHTVVSDVGLFRSGALDTGDEYTFKFDKPGTYHILCSIHPKMAATIIVE